MSVGQARMPWTTSECEAAGGKCVTESRFSQCDSADFMCVGRCDGQYETCLVSATFDRSFTTVNNNNI